MADIFISYRRQDCPAATGRLVDRLHTEFGADRVFLDLGDVVPGTDFVRRLEGALAGATVVLALVGPGWLRAAASNGRRRLDDPDDFVRREIERTLAHGTPLIPVLLEGARMPEADDLPPSLRAFASCQAVVLSNERWDTDIAALVRALASQYGIEPGGPAHRPAAPWWRWPAGAVADLAELLVHPRALIVRRAGGGLDVGGDRALLQALAMLVLCLVLGNLLLGMVLERPLRPWLAAGLTLGLLTATALAGTLAAAWRLVRRAPGWRRVSTVSAYLFGGAWLYFSAGAFAMILGVQLGQPDVFKRFFALATQGSEALSQAAALLEQAAHGPALVGGVIGNVVWLVGAAWAVRGWAAYRGVLGVGRLAVAAATLIWVGLLAGVGALAGWLAA